MNMPSRTTVGVNDCTVRFLRHITLELFLAFHEKSISETAAVLDHKGCQCLGPAVAEIVFQPLEAVSHVVRGASR